MMVLFFIFFEYLSRNSPNCSDEETFSKTIHLTSIQSAETIYDCGWYPLFQNDDLATHCFVCSSRDQPVRIYDANSGVLRATYVGLDNAYHPESAICSQFTLFGSQIFCGYRNKFRLFDVNRPGVATEATCFVTYHRKHFAEGVQGLLSCVAFQPYEEPHEESKNDTLNISSLITCKETVQ